MVVISGSLGYTQAVSIDNNWSYPKDSRGTVPMNWKGVAGISGYVMV